MHELKGRDEFDALAAINALLRIANNSRTSQHYEDVQRAIVVLVQFSREPAMSALSRIVRSFLFMINQVPPPRIIIVSSPVIEDCFFPSSNVKVHSQKKDCDFCIKELRQLLGFMTTADKSFLSEVPELLKMIASLWTSYRPSLLLLLDQLCFSLEGNIQPFLHRVLPLLDDVLSQSYDSEPALGVAIKALKVLRVLSPHLQEWSQYLCTVLACAFSEKNHARVLSEAIETAIHACRYLQFGTGIVPIILVVSGCLHREELRTQACECLAHLARQLGPDYIAHGHAARVNLLMYQYNVTSSNYEKVCLIFWVLLTSFSVSSLLVTSTP
jgi:hypothetical protein